MFLTVSDCCSTPNEQFFSYIMPRTSNTFNGMMVRMSIHGRREQVIHSMGWWWWCLLMVAENK